MPSYFTSYLSTLTFEQLKLFFKDIFESINPFFLLLRAAGLQDVVLIPGINLPNGSRSHGETTGVVPLLLGHGEAVDLEGVLVSEHSIRVFLLCDDEPLIEKEDVSACGRPARSLVDGELVLQGREDYNMQRSITDWPFINDQLANHISPFRLRVAYSVSHLLTATGHMCTIRSSVFYSILHWL